jgi:hypothetical protein
LGETGGFGHAEDQAIGFQQAWGSVLTGAQAQNLDMISSLGPRQSQECRGKKHGLVIGVGDEQTNALVPQSWEARLHDTDGVHVQDRNHHHQGRHKTE